MAGQHAAFDVETDEWERALVDVAGDLLSESEDFVVAFADNATDRMRNYCPLGEDGKHELLESIDARPGRDDLGFYIDVGTFGVFYSLFVEMGTSKAAAQPFIRPGLEEAIAAWGSR